MSDDALKQEEFERAAKLGGRLALAAFARELEPKLGAVDDELRVLDVCIDELRFGPQSAGFSAYSDIRESLHAAKEKVRNLYAGLETVVANSPDAPSSSTPADANVIDFVARRRARDEEEV